MCVFPAPALCHQPKGGEREKELTSTKVLLGGGDAVLGTVMTVTSADEVATLSPALSTQLRASLSRPCLNSVVGG